jgi:hypothetical protein
MTPTRWLIVGFWAVIILLAAKWMISGILAPPPPAPAPPKEWLPLPTPGTPLPAAPQADVRLTHYVPKVTPGSMSFTVDVTIQNFGQKKATGIQVRIQPYVGNTNSKTAPGPDEIPIQPGGDPMANVSQWLDFPDLDAGATETQSVTLPMRSDADPAESFKPQIVFQTVN